MELKLSSKKRFFVRVDKSVKELFGGNKYIRSLKKEKCSSRALNEKITVSYDCCSIEDYIVDEDNALTFSKLVKKIMEDKCITSKDIYKNSLINRKLFSALNVNDDYIPSRETAIMYCIALKLDYDSSVKLMKSAGYSFYEYSNFDMIVKYFLDSKIYNIDKINDALYYYTNKCLGYR